MSLRVRINLIITTLIVLFTLVIGNIIVEEMRSAIREEMEAGTKITLQHLNTVLYGSDLAHSDGAEARVLLRFLQHLGRVRAHEIRMYDARGRLVYTSPPSAYKAGRSAPEWFARLMWPESGEFTLDTAVARVVVAPDASRSILDAWDDLVRLSWLLLGFLVVVNAAVFFLLGRSLRPVRAILAGMSEMQRGKFDVRLPSFPLPEFDSIGRTFNGMAQALEESHAEARRLALVARQSSDATVIHDLQGNISFWNPAAARLFGYRSEEIVGRSATLLTPPGLESEVADNLRVICARRVIENLETQRLARDGRVVDVALSAAPLVDPASEQVIGEIVTLRDITEHKRAQQAEADLKQNRRLTRAIQTHLEEERRSIARELHDELGQCVTAIRTIGTAIANRARPNAPEIHDSARTIVEVAGHIYDVVHGIIRRLRPSALDNLGLTEALEEWLASWRERHPDIGVRLDLSGDLDNLGETVNITVYRIVQECLTNVVRHAAASRVEVAIARSGGCLEVSVRDNGKGLGERNESESARFGLMGMRERVEGLAGEFQIDSRPGEGLRVRASIPVPAAAPVLAE
ncbi:MAG TPA: PAS domain S-box protein [Burkholderiales bacterium]|nr:PAS domain S-box protein [Burkholderiales bacterium]